MKLIYSILLILTILSGCNFRDKSKNLQNKFPLELFTSQSLKEKPDYIAPDGSKIFSLPSLKGGGMCICELSVNQTTQAVKHKTVEEIWFFLSGKGEIWRKMGDKEDVTQVSKDISVTIPLGCEFQFRNTGKEPLRFIIVTMPPWPGENEAIKVRNFWK